jgi:hypothetical protein
MSTSRHVLALVSDHSDNVWRNWTRNLTPFGKTLSKTRFPQRSSKRIKHAPIDEFKRALTATQKRTETAHFACVTLAVEARPKPLSKQRVRKEIVKWAPININTVSKVYNASLVMDCCKARHVSEAAIVAVVHLLIVDFEADVNTASLDGLSALHIAAARGLPKLVKLLLAHGADIASKGRGEFRGYGSRKVYKGEHTPLGWTDAMMAHEERIRKQNGVQAPGLAGSASAKAAARSLQQCKRQLQNEKGTL